MIIDTGSSNFAVATSQCTGCGVTPLYAGALSTTSESIQYGSGSISGKVITSLGFSIGGISASMSVMGITSQSGFFNCANASQGIIGMAYSAIAQSNTFLFFLFQMFLFLFLSLSCSQHTSFLLNFIR